MNLTNFSNIGKQRIIDHCDFRKNVCYILVAIARPKENKSIGHNDVPVFRRIFSSEEELDRAYRRLQALSESYMLDSGEKGTFRLYLTTNGRDVLKSFYRFQQKLMDLSFEIHQNHVPSGKKIHRLDSLWISTLQKDQNKYDNYFTVDIDSVDESELHTAIDCLETETEIINVYSTPNGYHAITKPFGFPQVDQLKKLDYVDINTDDLVFIEMLE